MLRFCSLLLILAAALSAAPCDLIVSGRCVVTMDAQRHVIENGAIAIRADRIVAVGTRADIDRDWQPKRRIDRPDAMLTPGLINTHTHAAMSLFRGIADDLKLQDWLNNFIFPAEAKNVTPDFVRWGTRLACARNAALRYHDLHRHVLLRGCGGRSREGSRNARRSGRNHHQISRGGREDSRRRPEVRREVSHSVQRRSADRGRRRAARAVYQYRRNAEGRARACQQVQRAAY